MVSEGAVDVVRAFRLDEQPCDVVAVTVMQGHWVYLACVRACLSAHAQKRSILGRLVVPGNIRSAVVSRTFMRVRYFVWSGLLAVAGWADGLEERHRKDMAAQPADLHLRLSVGDGAEKAYRPGERIPTVLSFLLRSGACGCERSSVMWMRSV